MDWREYQKRVADRSGLRYQQVLSDAKVALAGAIAGLRIQQNLTQAALADAVGTAQPNISALERGDANPTLETLAKIAASLDTSVGRLVTLAERTHEAGEIAESAMATVRTRYAASYTPQAWDRTPSHLDLQAEPLDMNKYIEAISDGLIRVVGRQVEHEEDLSLSA